MPPRRMIAAAATVLFALPLYAAEPIRIELDTVATLTLDADADTVFVANPEIIDATPIALRKLFLLGKALGHTNLIVLDKQGQEILNTTASVVPSSQKVLTVFRGVVTTDHTCDPRCVARDPKLQDMQAPGAGTPVPVPSQAARPPSANAPAPGLPLPLPNSGPSAR